MRKVIAAVSVIPMLVLATPAGATPPVRNCSNPFTPYDRAELTLLAEQTFPDETPERWQERVDLALSNYDKNGDATLCVKFIGDARPNFVDNNKR